jgi:hypothetical protein
MPDRSEYIEVPRRGVTGMAAAAFAIIALLATATQLAAQGLEKGAGGIGQSAVHFYEPSGSYFQLIRDQRGDRTGHSWREAMQRAKRFDYKGRTARLAVVDNRALHRWLVRTFRLRGATWIGLRYWCSYRQLSWVTGDAQPFDDFGAWGSPWYRKWNCDTGNFAYMPVYYTDGTARWKASGPKKAFRYYLVEYPPRGEASDTEKG